MAKASICDVCGTPIKADSAMVLVNELDQPTRRYHGGCCPLRRDMAPDRA